MKRLTIDLTRQLEQLREDILEIPGEEKREREAESERFVTLLSS